MTPSVPVSSSAAAQTSGNFRNVYEVTGDSSAALQCLRGQTSAEADYNRHILNACMNGSSAKDSSKNEAEDASWLNGLSTVEAPLNARKRRDDWIVTYNRGLVLLTMGRTQESLEMVLAKLKPVISPNKKSSKSGTTNSNKLSKELTAIACRMAFLVLEGLLASSVPLPQNVATNNSDMVDRDAVVSWLTTAVEDVNDPTLKFQFSLYKGRLDFLDRKDSKLVDAKIRSCRKELKVAMEIFQHKLRPSGTTSDTLSLASSSALSAETDTQPNHQHLQGSSAGGGNGGGGSGDLGRVLQGQNRAALNLKANTEQLKGNVKKSLILLAEAANDDSTTTTTTSSSAADNNFKSSYESLHYNNLGVVYNTSGKRHLALHAWSKSLKACQSSDDDGTAAATASLGLNRTASRVLTFN